MSSYKHNLKMWKVLTFEGISYFLKITENVANNENAKEILVIASDLKKIWSEKLTHNELFERFEKENPIYEVNMDEALQYICNLIKNCEEQHCVLERTDNYVELKVKGEVHEAKMKYTFLLKPGSETDFYKEITVPLIKTVKCYEDQRSLLFALLKKKDEEISEHIFQAGEISRRSLITDKFNSEDYQVNDDNLLVGVVGNSKAFWKEFSSQNGDIAPYKANMKSMSLCDSPPKKKIKTYSAQTSTRNKYNKIEYKSGV